MKMKMLADLFQTMFHYFPDILERIGLIEDVRERPQYKIEEIIFAAIALHIFKAGTRNAFNSMRNQKYFEKNYFKTFGLRCPHLDTVNEVLEILSNEQLEQLKTYMVSSMIEKKVFYKFRILGTHYNIVFDATGMMTIDKANIKNFPNALHRTSKNDVVTYFINVLEAKLICKNGMAISIGTEWIENESEYDKQDCEQKAFVRLAERIKKMYPHLPICAVADGLYPNKTIFSECLRHGWNFIFTFKDGNLKTVWDDINGLRPLSEGNRTATEETVAIRVEKEGKLITAESLTEHSYFWINNLAYDQFKLSYIEMKEVKDDQLAHTFAYVTNYTVNRLNVRELAENGRIRFKIENEGFNVQKNLGYGLTHKFSRTSMNATKNYYTCMQIGHLINQIFECRADVRLFVKARETMTSLWKFFVGQFCLNDLAIFLGESLILEQRIQVRLAS